MRVTLRFTLVFVLGLAVPVYDAVAETFLDVPNLLSSQMRITREKVNALQLEVANKGKPSALTPSDTPLVGSNGASPKTLLRTSDIPPVALSKTLQRLTDGERTALAASISSEIEVFAEQLNRRLAIEEKTPELNDEIAGLNAAISAKRQALEFTRGNVTDVSNAAAESFANTGNPYFLMCGEALWARTDPLKWIDQLQPQKSALIQAGRSVGMLSLNDRLAGTAFVVGKSHILTNLHVVKVIADYDTGARVWKIRQGVKVTFDVEYPVGPSANCLKPNPAKAYYVNGVFSVPSAGVPDDIAVLLTSFDQDFPAPLAVRTKPNEKYAGNMTVAVIGYPGPPADMTVAEQIQFFSPPDTLSPQFPFKRLSEGFTGSQKVTEDGFFVHKANTAGGNSGSPIFDLSDGSVVGIHVEGNNRFNDVMGYNRGLTGDRVRKLLAKAGLSN